MPAAFPGFFHVFRRGNANAILLADVLRIDQQDGVEGCPTLILSGALTGRYVGELERVFRRLLDAGCTVTLDLKNLRSAGRDGLAFLLAATEASVRLTECPPYICLWLEQERRARGARA